jgi:hypothetical protein
LSSSSGSAVQSPGTPNINYSHHAAPATQKLAPQKNEQKPLQQFEKIWVLGLIETNTDGPTIIHNDNAACVQWSHNMTTKGIIQIRENAVREQVHKSPIQTSLLQASVYISLSYQRRANNILAVLA